MASHFWVFHMTRITKIIVWFLSLILFTACATMGSPPKGTLRTSQVIKVFMGEEFKHSGVPYEDARACGFRDEDIRDGRFGIVRTTRDDLYGYGGQYAVYAPPEILLELGDIVEARTGAPPPQPEYNRIMKIIRRAEVIDVHHDDRRWQIANKIAAYRDEGFATAITEYVPLGQTIHNWSELLTVQSLYGAQEQMNLEQAKRFLKEEVTQRCPNIVWDLLRQDSKEFFYEWRSAGCRAIEDQHELARVVFGKTAMHRVAYTAKQAQMPGSTQKSWMELLGVAAIRNTQDKDGGSN